MVKKLLTYLVNGSIITINGQFSEIMTNFGFIKENGVIEKLEQIDRAVFLTINSLHTPILDIAMWYISTIILWIPLFLFFFYYAYKKGNLSLLLLIIFGLAFCILLADRISVEAFKEVFQRYRPSHNLEIKQAIHSVERSTGNPYLGGLYGFVSSHAANFFAITAFLVAIFRRYSKQWYLLFLWAALVGYSRIYLGVHYPADIIGGALLGIAIGIAVYQASKLVTKRYGIIKN